MQSSGDGMMSGSESMGTYAYVCEGGVEFMMEPSSDMSSIELTPGANATFAKTQLARVESFAGARFEGGNMMFTGAGEEVQLAVGGGTLVCNPKPNPDMAPWNWGDAGEGAGSVKQPVELIVSESIVGKWQSNEDAKFVREFKDGGIASDWYDNETVSEGSWKVFTKENPVEVSFPLEANVVYIQMTMQGTQGDTLNFKLVKLTPEVLELIYMDRGGTLTFKAVQ